MVGAHEIEYGDCTLYVAIHAIPSPMWAQCTIEWHALSSFGVAFARHYFFYTICLFVCLFVCFFCLCIVDLLLHCHSMNSQSRTAIPWVCLSDFVCLALFGKSKFGQSYAHPNPHPHAQLATVDNTLTYAYYQHGLHLRWHHNTLRWTDCEDQAASKR
jgi:hypothetical protein